MKLDGLKHLRAFSMCFQLPVKHDLMFLCECVRVREEGVVLRSQMAQLLPPPTPHLASPPLPPSQVATAGSPAPTSGGC